MKGIVFTEFLEMLESRFGLAMVDELVEAAALPSGGSYAATGTYPPRELAMLISAFCELTGRERGAVVREFGQHLFGRLASMYPGFIKSCPDAFAFLQTIDNHIHVEVRKIYPDADLPSFVSRLSADGRELIMEYRSPRRLEDLAQGLMEGALAHYGERAEIRRGPLPEGEGGCVFRLRRVDG